MPFISGTVVSCRTGEENTGLFRVMGYDSITDRYSLQHLTRHTPPIWKSASEVFAPDDFEGHPLIGLLAKANAEGLNGDYFNAGLKPELGFKYGISVVETASGFEISMIVYDDPSDPGDSNIHFVGHIKEVDEAVRVLKSLAALKYPASGRQVDKLLGELKIHD